MKKTVAGWILLFLGAFILVVGILALTIGPGLTQRTPLNVNSYTYLTGQAQKLNPATGKVDNVPVTVLNRTQVDPKKSDGSVIVFVSYTCANINRDNPPACLKDNDERLISNSIDVFAADRHTGMAVNNPKYVGADATLHRGLVNKFPFDTQRKDYPLWDTVLNKTTTAAYVKTTDIGGVTVYEFKVDVPPTKAKVAGDVEGTYETHKDIYVEPKTGAIIDQRQHEIRLLPDGSTVLDMSLRFTDATVSKGVSDAKANIKQLDLTGKWLPLAGLVLGVLLLLLGLFLLIAGRRSARQTY
jgi:hypothetical protein